MTSTFTPKQAALALGVSESSVKRWVDSGRLSAGKTCGGHRKLALSAVVDMVRETGQELSHPEILGMVAKRTRCELAESRERCSLPSSRATRPSVANCCWAITKRAALPPTSQTNWFDPSSSKSAKGGAAAKCRCIKSAARVKW